MSLILVCNECQSQRITKDATVELNIFNEWKIKTIDDANTYCLNCDSLTQGEWVEDLKPEKVDKKK